MSPKPTKIFRVQIGRMGTDKVSYSDMCAKCIGDKNATFPPDTFITPMFQIPINNCKVCNAPNVLQEKD